jgi:hypothetical protein
MVFYTLLTRLEQSHILEHRRIESCGRNETNSSFDLIVQLIFFEQVKIIPAP